MVSTAMSLMSDGYRGIRVLRLIPPGQHRHATTGAACGPVHGAAACLPRSLGMRGAPLLS